MNPMQSPSHDAAKPDLEPDHHHNFRDNDLDGDMLREKCGVFGGKSGPKTPTVGNRVPILSRIESGAKVDSRLTTTPVSHWSVSTSSSS